MILLRHLPGAVPANTVLGIHRGRAVGTTLAADGSWHLFSYNLHSAHPKMVDLGPGAPTAMSGRYLVGGNHLWRLGFRRTACPD